jgi:hypothetical protein
MFYPLGTRSSRSLKLDAGNVSPQTMRQTSGWSFDLMMHSALSGCSCRISAMLQRTAGGSMAEAT